MTRPNPPLVLAVGGHDPSGGAGIQADIEAISACGCRALTVVTTLTAQNTCGVGRLLPQPAAQVAEHCRLILRESRVAAVKIGLLGDATVARTLAGVLAEIPDVPAVLDPVLASGGGTPMAGEAVRQAITGILAPYVTLMTPNSLEARQLTGEDGGADCALALVRGGCASVLITGAHEAGDEVVNRLYGLAGLLHEQAWPRLDGEFHGSGCTLAAAAAAELAKGAAVVEAVNRAQAFTWNALKYAVRTGHCQLTPNRLWQRQ